MQNKRILVVIGQWPSKSHPYLVWLFFKLKKIYPNLLFFMFEKPEKKYGEAIIGKDSTEACLKGSLFKRAFSYKPLQHIKACFIILSNWKQSVRIFLDCKKRGLSTAQSYGQLYYYGALLGKEFDLIYINALQTARHIASRLFFGNAQLIASSRGQDFDFHPDRYDEVLSMIDHLHVLGVYLGQKAINKCFPENSITVIPPAALPISGVQPKTITSSNHFSIATSARLTWTKGFIYSLRAVSEVVHQLPDINISYHIIGDGPEKEFLQVEAVRLGIQNNVVFHGWKSQKEVNELVSIADIYLLLSIEEGFNNSVLQAQNLGIPCVVSNTGGLPENVEDGVTGLVVPRYDSHAAAEAILKLIQAPELRKKMGEAASQRVKQHFSLEKQVQRYADMFEKVIQNYEDHIRLQ